MQRRRAQGWGWDPPENMVDLSTIPAADPACPWSSVLTLPPRAGTYSTVLRDGTFRAAEWDGSDWRRNGTYVFPFAWRNFSGRRSAL